MLAFMLGSTAKTRKPNPCGWMLPTQLRASEEKLANEPTKLQLS
jgi:hypothetical protein